MECGGLLHLARLRSSGRRAARRGGGRGDRPVGRDGRGRRRRRPAGARADLARRARCGPHPQDRRGGRRRGSRRGLRAAAHRALDPADRWRALALRPRPLRPPPVPAARTAADLGGRGDVPGARRLAQPAAHGRALRVVRHRNAALGHRRARPRARALRPRAPAARGPRRVAAPPTAPERERRRADQRRRRVGAGRGRAGGRRDGDPRHDERGRRIGRCRGPHPAPLRRHLLLALVPCRAQEDRSVPRDRRPPVGAPRPLPRLVRAADRRRVAGAAARRLARGDAGGRGGLCGADGARRGGAARQRRRALLPVAQRGAHTRGRCAGSRRLAQPLARHHARPARPQRARGRRAQRALDAAARREVLRRTPGPDPLHRRRGALPALVADLRRRPAARDPRGRRPGPRERARSRVPRRDRARRADGRGGPRAGRRWPRRSRPIPRTRHCSTLASPSS